MRSLIKLVLALVALLSVFGSSYAFTGPRLPANVARSTQPATSLNMVFGNKKTKAQKAEEEAKAAMYWEGEWVCKDCGYIYQRVSYDI